jgi:hypothetical protein
MQREVSVVDKYRCYGKDDLGHPYDALSMKDEFGDWVRQEDYEALRVRFENACGRISALESERDDYILKQKAWEEANDELRTVHLKMVAALREALSIYQAMDKPPGVDGATITAWRRQTHQLLHPNDRGSAPQRDCKPSGGA